MATIIFVIYWVAALFSFFVLGCLLAALFSSRFRRALRESEALARLGLLLTRVVHNPLLTPGRRYWQTEGVFNPAALILGDRTHLVYRSVGADGVSRFGYASSPDGLLFDDYLPYPIYTAAHPRGPSTAEKRYSPALYPSGGSWGGCEDPRMVEVGGTIYLTFNMFDGWDYIRTAVLATPAADFLARRFYWRGPHLLSPEGERHKNWVLFPEKIRGKFAVLHSLFGPSINEVGIEYVDDIETYTAPRGFQSEKSPDPLSRPNQRIAWHYRMRGAGPPPIKTEQGWLLFYHATQESEPHRYKVGAMLLDLNEPTRVLCRSSWPVLEPNERYENDGKPGIVYACGAVVRDNKICLYYGGADKVICAATAPLTDFLKALRTTERVSLTPRLTYAPS